jgi:hypothetical protein
LFRNSIVGLDCSESMCGVGFKARNQFWYIIFKRWEEHVFKIRMFTRYETSSIRIVYLFMKLFQIVNKLIKRKVNLVFFKLFLGTFINYKFLTTFI